MRVHWHVRLAAGLALLLLTSGCGGDEGQPGAAAANDSSRADAVQTTIYFLTAEGSAPIGVPRAISNHSPLAREALRTLLAGPTPDERDRGIRSALPESAEIRSFRIEGNSNAVVDLSGLSNEADGVERVRVITQITRSLVGLSGIEEVWLRNEGNPWGLRLMSDGVANIAYGYDDLIGFFRICSSKPGTEAEEGDCFTALP